MNKESVRVHVFFQDPFWVGVFEQESEGRLSVSKVVFGPEPKDYDVNKFVLEHYWNLRFSPPVEVDEAMKGRMNPKRMQRLIKKQVQEVGMGTKSQQALKIQQEQGKLERKSRSRKEKEEEKLFQFQLKQQKRKEKHKGR